ncbi:hypothetical protein DFS33DRAFT_1457157 [Desarmillaria ectypa]|nr:hypothetical protein DFS33DRAFT_1457157 [Desarmillaria ectypa]
MSVFNFENSMIDSIIRCLTALSSLTFIDRVTYKLLTALFFRCIQIREEHVESGNGAMEGNVLEECKGDGGMDEVETSQYVNWGRELEARDVSSNKTQSVRLSIMGRRARKGVMSLSGRSRHQKVGEQGRGTKDGNEFERADDWTAKSSSIVVFDRKNIVPEKALDYRAIYITSSRRRSTSGKNVRGRELEGEILYGVLHGEREPNTSNAVERQITRAAETKTDGAKLSQGVNGYSVNSPSQAGDANEAGRIEVLENEKQKFVREVVEG